MADGAACFRQDSSGPALLRVPLRAACLPVPAFHRLRGAFPDPSGSQASTMSGPYNPGHASTSPVWALPRSLATTCGIILIFSSCGYLDVSVPRVCPLIEGVRVAADGLSHSDIPGSKVICTSPELFAAYHVLPRL